MDNLPEFTKSLSIVDFLAYFSPGAIFTLYSYWLLPENIGSIFREPINTLFPENELALAVYFCVISYLLGMLLSEFSYWIWLAVKKVVWKDKKEQSDTTSTSRRLAAVPHHELIRKSQLFQSYFEFCRCFTVVLPLLLIEASCFETKGTPDCCLWVFFLVVELCLIVRAHRFEAYQKEYQEELRRKLLESTGAKSAEL